MLVFPHPARGATMSWSQITSQIWVGGEINNNKDTDDKNPRDPSIAQAMLNQIKPTEIIDCRSGYDDFNMLELAGFNPVKDKNYKWDGVDDWRAPAAVGLQSLPLKFFYDGLDFWLPMHPEKNKRVYVHCTQGINRSATLTYAFLLAEGYAEARAIEMLNAHRVVTLWNTLFDCPWRSEAEEALKKTR